MAPSDGCEEDLQSLIKSLNALQWTCWKNYFDPTASRALARLHRPMAELMGYAVASILEEMRGRPEDPQVQSMGVHMLRALIHDNEALKRIVVLGGGVEVLVQGVRHHPTDELLLSCTLEAIDELHGLPSLLQALDHLKESPPGVRAALWAFSSSARSKWSEVEKLPPGDVVRILLSAVDAHQGDTRILAGGLELLSDLALELPDMRGAFCALGGWPWLLQVMEANGEHGRIQLHGCKLMSSLGRGGSYTEAHVKRAIAILERTLCQHDSDDVVLYWAFWAVSQLNGARALVVPMRSGAFKTPVAIVAALRSLGSVGLGQGDGATVEDMPGVIDAVVYAMNMFSERYDVLYECTGVLGRVAAFVAGAGNGGGAPAFLLSAQVAVNALLHLLKVRMSDAHTVCYVCDALAEIVDACTEDSPVRASIRTGLCGQDSGVGGGQGDHLLARILAAHVSNDHLQAYCMRLSGTLHGVAPVLHQMAQHCASHAVQLPAIKTLAMLYGERIELEPADAECLPEAIRAVLAAMAKFPENIVLQQNACYALCTMAEHCSDGRIRVSDEAFTQCVAAAAEALGLVRGQCDGRRDPASYNALYLRKEATRCIVSICAARPAVSRWLRERGVQELLADALKSTADGVWDGRRDPEAEETLRLELLALSYVLGPPAAILESLRRWGVGKPAVARAAADAVVDLARGALSRGPLQDISDPTVAAVSAPAQALNAAGCGAELLAAMRAHAADEDLQGRLHLAVGFVGGHVDVVPAA